MATDLRDTALNPNMPMRRDQLAQMTATPRSPRLGFLADAMMALKEFANRVQVPAGVPLLGGEGVGSLLLGKAPEELVEMSYGNMPMRINPYAGQTASFVPEMKPSRGAQVADLLSLAPTPGGARAAAGLAGMADMGGMERAIFIGSKAKTWDKDAAKKAVELEKAGASPESIWAETGTFRGADGKWRQEISDKEALFNASSVAGRRVENDLPVGYAGLDLGPTVGGILEHQPLQAAYGTDLTSGTRIGNKNTMFGDGIQGSIDASGVVTINAPAKADQARSTTLHELQHAIQRREGFAQGGNSMMAFLPQNKEAFALLAQKRREMQTPLSLDEYTKQAWGMDAPTDEVRKAYADYVKTTKQASLSPAADRAAQEWAAKEYYRRLAGEAEARAVQARMNMTPEQRRAAYPYTSYDVPVEQLIIRQD